MNLEEYKTFAEKKSISELNIIKHELKEDIKELKKQRKKMKKTQFFIKYKLLKKLFAKNIEYINPEVLNKLKIKQECLKIINDTLSK